MTTIAWDGKILAADTQETVGGNIRANALDKIHKLPDGSFIATCGDTQDGLLAKQWFSEGCPKEKPSLNESFHAIYIKYNKGGFLNGTYSPFKVEDKLALIPIRGKYAIGSGRDFALAAMHLGHGAISAVTIACELDLYTSKPVTSVLASSEPNPVC